MKFIKFNHIFLIAALFSNACAYNFANTASTENRNIKSLAFESIYDTSREVISHEILWQEIQKGFARNGRLRLHDIKGADALLRTHLRRVAITQSGLRGPKNELPDPEPWKEDEPLAPREFRSLALTNRLAQNESIAFQIDVEVWDLRSKQMIFFSSYAVSDKYKIQANNRKALTHLRSEETKDERMTVKSEGVANLIVNDVLRNL